MVDVTECVESHDSSVVVVGWVVGCSCVTCSVQCAVCGVRCRSARCGEVVTPHRHHLSRALIDAVTFVVCDAERVDMELLADTDLGCA